VEVRVEFSAGGNGDEICLPKSLPSRLTSVTMISIIEPLTVQIVARSPKSICLFAITALVGLNDAMEPFGVFMERMLFA
jgi:hypothetical protein